MLPRVEGALRQVRDSGLAFRAVFATPNLRRLQLAFAGSVIGHWAYAVAVSVYAYKVDGASGVGLVWLVRMVPGGVVSPFAAMLGDRYPRKRVMLASVLVRAAMIVAAAAAAWAGADPAVVYTLAALIAVAAAPFRPAEASIVPELATTPSQLTAANVVASTIESVGFFAGPALAGAFLAFASPQTVFVITGGTMLWAALCISRLDVDESGRPRPETEGVAGVLREAGAGFTAIGRDPRLRILVTLFASSTLVVGAVEVLTVLIAVDVIGAGTKGVGFLQAAFGIGALAGAVAAAALVGVRRLSLPFIGGTLLWGVPVMLVAAWPETAPVAVMFALTGAGNTVLDVAGDTLVQRAVPEEVMARVFGVLQFLWLATIGVGAVATPPLVDWLGVRTTILVVGAIMPVLVAALGLRLIRIDAEAEAPAAERLALLRGIPIFAPLGGPALEGIAQQLQPLAVAEGTEVIRQGAEGDLFYVVAAGELVIEADGVEVARARPGGYFGEIALLRNVPRTATVRALSPCRLFSLGRAEFLAAVTGHSSSVDVAESVVSSRLAGLPQRGSRAMGG